MELSEVLQAQTSESRPSYTKLTLQDGLVLLARPVTRRDTGRLTEIVSKQQLGKKELRRVRALTAA